MAGRYLLSYGERLKIEQRIKLRSKMSSVGPQTAERATNGSRLDDHRALHIGGVKVAVVGEGPGACEGMLKPVPWFEESGPAREHLPASGAVQPDTPSAGHRVGFLRAVCVQPDHFLADPHLHFSGHVERSCTEDENSRSNTGFNCHRPSGLCWARSAGNGDKFSGLHSNRAFFPLFCHNRKSVHGRHLGVGWTSLETPVVVNVGPLSDGLSGGIREYLESAGAGVHLPQEVNLDLGAGRVLVNDEMTLTV